MPMVDLEDDNEVEKQKTKRVTSHQICKKCGRPKKCLDIDCPLIHCNCGQL